MKVTIFSSHLVNIFMSFQNIENQGGGICKGEGSVRKSCDIFQFLNRLNIRLSPRGINNCLTPHGMHKNVSDGQNTKPIVQLHNCLSPRGDKQLFNPPMGCTKMFHMEKMQKLRFLP